jgi:hypothetical protein
VSVLAVMMLTFSQGRATAPITFNPISAPTNSPTRSNKHHPVSLSKATLLAGGKVLIAGNSMVAEIFDR